MEDSVLSADSAIELNNKLCPCCNLVNFLRNYDVRVYDRIIF